MKLRILIELPDLDGQCEAIKEVLDAHNRERPIYLTISGRICAGYVLTYTEVAPAEGQQP